MGLQDIILDKSRYRKTTLKEYDVTISRPNVATGVHNILDDSFKQTSSYTPYVVMGPCGEENVFHAKDLVGKYKFSDGTMVSEFELNTRLAKRSKVRATRLATNEIYWVLLVPHTLQNLQIGRLLVNRQNVTLYGNEALYSKCLEENIYNGDVSKLEGGFAGQVRTMEDASYFLPYHGRGDYLVCKSLPNGEPDTNTLTVINGVLFERVFNMTPLRTVSLDVAFLLLGIYIQDMTSDNSTKYQKLQSECESTSAYIVETYQIVVGDKQGKFTLKFNRSDRDLTVTYNIYGRNYSISNYSKIRASNPNRDEIDVIIYYVSSALGTFKKTLLTAKVELTKEMGQLITFAFNEIKKIFEIIPGRYASNMKIKAGKSLLALQHAHPRYKQPIKVLVFADANNQTFESIIKVGSDEYEIQEPTTITNQEQAIQFAQDFRSSYTRVLNGFIANAKDDLEVSKERTQRSTRTASQSTVQRQQPRQVPMQSQQEVADWYEFLQQEIQQGLSAVYSGTVTTSVPKANQVYYKVDNSTVLVTVKESDNSVKILNSTSNVKVDLKSKKPTYLKNLAANCVKFSQK